MQDLNEKLIPRNLPYNIKLIMSCNSTSKDVADSIVGSHKWIEITLDNFDKEESKIFIEKYMDKYNKVCLHRIKAFTNLKDIFIFKKKGFRRWPNDFNVE